MSSRAPLDPSAYRNIVVLTGAGISVASGLRPYRGPGGLWTENPELMANTTLAAAAEDPAQIWRNFVGFRAQVATAEPNPAHLALARFEASLAAESTLTVITQNVDGLHRRAGSRSLIELHGSLARTCCSNPSCDLPTFDDDTCPAEPPPCPRCGAPLRPAIVLFDEALPARPEWESKRALRSCDLFIAVGTSGTVSPASNFVRSAAYVGARTLLVNLEAPGEASPFDDQLLGPAEQLLPRLFSPSPP